MKKSFILLAVVFVNTLANAGNLPFVGTRAFNFMGGTGTSETITIHKNGMMTLKFHGVCGSGVIHKGK